MKWYRLAKDGTGVERYVKLVQGQESVRLLFRQRTGSAGLLGDKKICRIVSYERCIMCDRQCCHSVGFYPTVWIFVP